MIFNNRFEQRLAAVEQLLRDHLKDMGAHHEREIALLKRNHEIELENQARNAQRNMEELSGISAEVMGSELHIQDFEGTVRLVRRCQGLKVTGCTFEHFLHRIAVSREDAEWIKPPTLTRFDRDKDLKLRPRRVGSGPADYVFAVEITPPLREKESLDYAFDAVIANCAAMSQEDATAPATTGNLKCASASLIVEYPWKRLELKISFPRGYPFTPHALVFIGKTENRHDTETERVRKLLRCEEDNKVSLIVENPLLNFRYSIYWDAPTKIELEDIKKKFANEKGKRANQDTK